MPISEAEQRVRFVEAARAKGSYDPEGDYETVMRDIAAMKIANAKAGR